MWGAGRGAQGPWGCLGEGAQGHADAGGGGGRRKAGLSATSASSGKWLLHVLTDLKVMRLVGEGRAEGA